MNGRVRRQLLWDFPKTDLPKLRLQYSKAEEAMRKYTKKTQSLIDKGVREIEWLQSENEELLCNVRVSESSYNRWTDAAIVKDLTVMLSYGDEIAEELEAERGKLATLKDEILRWERKLAGQRTCLGTAHRTLLKNTRAIENKLYRGCKCFNKLMARNAVLREELKKLLVEKRQFQRIQSQMIKELHTVQKDVSDLMAKCTKAFNKSAKNQEEQRTQKDQNAMDVTQYQRERSKLNRETSHYRDLLDFLNKKAMARNNQDMDLVKVKCKQLDSKELEVKDFEDAIEQILRDTEERDLDQLIRRFIQTEEQNYTLLNFVNGQFLETEAIRKQISQICSERELFVAEQKQQQEQHRALQMGVVVKLSAAEQQLAVYQQQVEFLEQLLGKVREGVLSVLRISYGSSVICDQLDSPVQDEKVTENLRMLGDRVSELLTLQSYLHFKESLNQEDDDSLSTTAGKLLEITVPAVSVTSAAVIPEPVDDLNMGESALLEAKEPMTREDLLELVKNRIERNKNTSA